jgi:hypothetical protein
LVCHRYSSLGVIERLPEVSTYIWKASLSVARAEQRDG